MQSFHKTKIFPLYSPKSIQNNCISSIKQKSISVCQCACITACLNSNIFCNWQVIIFIGIQTPSWEKQTEKHKKQYHNSCKRRPGIQKYHGKNSASKLPFDTELWWLLDKYTYILLWTVISDVKRCSDAECLNNGNCTDMDVGYTCSCEDGFTGWNCETGMLISTAATTNQYTLTVSKYITWNILSLISSGITKLSSSWRGTEYRIIV